ncbi:MAG TPA: hypothetical protein VEG30_14850 [Terriglobales bacterium]|nr:hypothetical protein [Terriglobales bacterium]
MAVYKRRYKPYEGPLTPRWSRFFVLTRYAAGDLFQSRFFVALLFFCMFPLVAGATFIYVANSETAQAILKLGKQNFLLVDARFFCNFLIAQAWLALLLTSWVGPVLIAGDLANGALPLFLSRSFSRAEYVLGKFAVLMGLLSVVTWLPLLLLFFLEAGLASGNWLWPHLWMAGAILLASWVWIVVLAAVALAISAWVKWRIVATAVTYALFFVPAGFGEAFDAVMRTNWGRLLNLQYLFRVIVYDRFHLTLDFFQGFSKTPLPIAAAWATLLIVCLASLAILNRRLRAREVVRG